LEVALSFWIRGRLPARLGAPAALIGVALAGTLALLAAPAGAALPTGNTICTGKLKDDPSGKSIGEPDLLGYAFSCSNDISAYSLVVDRLSGDGQNVDDFNPNPFVVLPTPYPINPAQAGQISTTESVACGGQTPSNGINCYAVNASNSLGVVSAGDSVEGSIDPTASYCKYLPQGAKPGTPAVPRAIVELIVTDASGAEDGPFELFPSKKCKAVPNVVPPKAKKGSKSKTKSKPGKHAKK
jgi:hypothetical protein